MIHPGNLRARDRLPVNLKSSDPITLHQAIRPWLSLAAKLTVSAGILAACISMLDVAALSMAITRVEPGPFLLATVMTIAGTVILPAIVTRRALETNRIRLSVRQLVVINFAMRFYMLVLPRAISIGIRWLRYRQGGPGHDAMALMVYERLMQLLAMTSIGTVALVVERDALAGHWLALLLVSAASAVVCAAVLLPFVAPWAARLLSRIAVAGDRIAPRFVARRIGRFMEAIDAYQGLSTATSLQIMLMSLMSYVLFIASAYVLLVSMDLHISLTALTWIRPLVFLLTLLPFTVGGLGVREVGFVGLLGYYGVPPHEAMAYSLAIFAIQVVIALVGVTVEVLAAVRRRWAGRT